MNHLLKFNFTFHSLEGEIQYKGFENAQFWFGETQTFQLVKNFDEGVPYYTSMGLALFPDVKEGICHLNFKHPTDANTKYLLALQLNKKNEISLYWQDSELVRVHIQPSKENYNKTWIVNIDIKPDLFTP